MASPFDEPQDQQLSPPQDNAGGPPAPPQQPQPPYQPPEKPPPSPSSSANWLDELNQRFSETQPETLTPQSQPPAQPPTPQPEPELQPEPQLPPIEKLQQEPTLAAAPPPPPPPTTGEGPGETEPRNQEGGLPGVLGVILKIFLALLFISLLVFGGIRLFGIIAEKRAPKTIILTYWGLWEDKNIMNTVISDFEREHPSIKIDYQKRDIKQYRETLKTRMAQEHGPDIFRFHNSWLPMFKTDLLALPKAVIGNTPDKNFYPVIARDLKIDGAYYGLPLEIDTLVLFINTALLENPPKTWDELKNIASTLTIKESEGKIKTSGVALGTFDNVNHAGDIISLMLAQNGVDPKNIKGAPQNAEDTLAFYTSFAKGPGKVWDSALDPSLLAFSKGNLAMFFGYSWDIFIIQALAPGLQFKVYPVPQLDENNKLAIASYWVEGVSKKSKNQKAAFEFLAFLGKKETLQKLYSEEAKTRLFGEPFARVDMADSLSDSPYLTPVLEQAKYAVSTPFSQDTFDNGLNTELLKYLEDAVGALLENTSPQTAVETLIKGVDQVFTKYGVR